MKNINTILVLLVALCFSNLSYGQLAKITKPKKNEVFVENVLKDHAIQIIEMASLTSEFTLDKFDRDNLTLLTKYKEWSSFGIKNRAKLQFTALNGGVMITMVNREYLSSDGWYESPTNLSKKNKKKYLGAMADKIKAIADNQTESKLAVLNSTIIRAFNPVLAETDKFKIELVKFRIGVETSEGRILPFMFEFAFTNKNSDIPLSFRIYPNTLDSPNGVSFLANSSGSYGQYLLPYAPDSLGRTYHYKNFNIKKGETIPYYYYRHTIGSSGTDEDHTKWTFTKFPRIDFPLNVYIQKPNESIRHMIYDDTPSVYSIPVPLGDEFEYPKIISQNE